MERISDTCRTELLEEKNALLAHAHEEWETPEDIKESAEYFRPIRWQQLKRIRDRIAEAEGRAAPTRRTQNEPEEKLNPRAPPSQPTASPPRRAKDRESLNDGAASTGSNA